MSEAGGPILGAAIQVRRSPGVEPLVVLTEELGLSDPDGLDDPSIVIVPKEELRKLRRGCITLDVNAATTLGFYADHPYVRKDSLLWVAPDGRTPGWYVVEKIQDLTALRAEGGAHVFLIEKPFHQATATASIPALQVRDDGVDLEKLKAATEELVAEQTQRQENADLGELEDLL